MKKNLHQVIFYQRKFVKQTTINYRTISHKDCVMYIEFYFHSQPIT